MIPASKGSASNAADASNASEEAWDCENEKNGVGVATRRAAEAEPRRGEGG
jgi:hypothetical protein